MGPWLVEVKTSEELEPWLDGGPPDRPYSMVMVVRGDGPMVRAFLPNALDAAKVDPKRVVVWLKNTGALDAENTTSVFGDGRLVPGVGDRRRRQAACRMGEPRPVEVEDAGLRVRRGRKSKRVEGINV